MPKSYFQGYADSLIQSPDFISFSRLVYEIVNHNAPAAMIFERIAYWHGTSAKTGKSRLEVVADDKLWLAKNYPDWEDECCVNASTARKALDRLEALGLIETKVGKFNNVNTLFIRVIHEQFEHLSNMVTSSVQNGQIPSVQNGRILYIQESTKEQESTSIDDSVAPTETTTGDDALPKEEHAIDKITEVRMKEFAKEIGKLPKGQQQRVAGIVRALACWQYQTRNYKVGKDEKHHSPIEAWRFVPDFNKLKTYRQYEIMLDAFKTWNANFGDVYKLEECLHIDEAYMDAFGRWWALVKALAMTTQKTSKEGKKLYRAMMDDANKGTVSAFISSAHVNQAAIEENKPEQASYEYMGLGALFSMIEENDDSPSE